MTDNEIVKAWEVLDGWQQVALQNDDGTDIESPKLYEAIEVVRKQINRLQAENERLKEEASKTRRKALLEASSKFAGHSDYHGDTILCKLICMAEGKEVKSARPLDKAEIKAEAYKEFAERLLSCYEGFDETNEVILFENLAKAIEDTKREMEASENAD